MGKTPEHIFIELTLEVDINGNDYDTKNPCGSGRT